MTHSAESTLIVSVNWIGDTIMSMPALQLFRQQHPDATLTILCKPSVGPLWDCSDVPNHVIRIQPGWRGSISSAADLRKAPPFDRAIILPHSFRSAFIPWLARIPERVGYPGHGRRWLVNHLVPQQAKRASQHQAYEYLDLLGLPDTSDLPAPQLRIPASARDDAMAQLADLPRPLIGLVPGAARGPSKQWPPKHFIAVGRHFAQHENMGILVTGAPNEQALCQDIAAQIGVNTLVCAGHTSFMQWLSHLSLCDAVVANDSGAMHVAASVGAAVVAIFGITDPDKTGPLGMRTRVLQKSTQRNRDVPRVSAAATAALEAVTPGHAIEAVNELLNC